MQRVYSSSMYVVGLRLVFSLHWLIKIRSRFCLFVHASTMRWRLAPAPAWFNLSSFSQAWGVVCLILRFAYLSSLKKNKSNQTHANCFTFHTVFKFRWFRGDRFVTIPDPFRDQIVLWITSPVITRPKTHENHKCLCQKLRNT